jgi:hypothetical protein
MSTPLDRVAPSTPQAPAPTPARDAPPPTGVVGRALSVFRKTPATEVVRETEAASLDPVQALLALAEEQAERPPPASLAEQLLDYIAPHSRKPLNLTASRIITLLGVAADHTGRSAREFDEIKRLGGEALEQELRAHRDLAERRATLLGPAVPKAPEAPGSV